MPIGFLASALLAVVLATNLTVEAVKKLLVESHIKYSSNLLAAIIAMVISLGITVIYVITNDIPIDTKIVVQGLVLMYLGFLVSTVGYDKVKQMLGQLLANAKDKKK